jgi:DNA replication factor GINS
MDLDELQSVQSRERQTDSLQQLRESFYAEAGEFIQSLRQQRDQAAERSDDPFDSPEVNRLTDDINTAEQTVEAIYERRVGKLVKMASLAAADMNVDDEGLTNEERSLFDDLVDSITTNRAHVLDVLAGNVVPAEHAPSSSDPEPTPEPTTESSEPESEAPVPPEPEAMDAEAPPAKPEEAPPEEALPEEAPPAPDDGGSIDAADVMGGGNDERGSGTEQADEEAPSESVDRTMVRITADVGEILGVDEREYDLSTDDVVTLPKANAEPLVQRDAAEKLE